LLELGHKNVIMHSQLNNERPRKISTQSEHWVVSDKSKTECIL